MAGTVASPQERGSHLPVVLLRTPGRLREKVKISPGPVVEPRLIPLPSHLPICLPGSNMWAFILIHSQPSFPNKDLRGPGWS